MGWRESPGFYREWYPNFPMRTRHSDETALIVTNMQMGTVKVWVAMEKGEWRVDVLLRDDNDHGLFRDTPKSIGGIKNRINEIKDLILGQYIFIVQIFNDDSEVIMDVIVVAIVSETIRRHEWFYMTYIGDFSGWNEILLDNTIQSFVIINEA